MFLESEEFKIERKKMLINKMFANPRLSEQEKKVLLNNLLYEFDA